jgi:hypothetical protein
VVFNIRPLRFFHFPLRLIFWRTGGKACLPVYLPTEMAKAGLLFQGAKAQPWDNGGSLWFGDCKSPLTGFGIANSEERGESSFRTNRLKKKSPNPFWKK